MQAAQNLFAGEQGVAYIPMPKGRGFTPRLVSRYGYDVIISAFVSSTTATAIQ